MSGYFLPVAFIVPFVIAFAVAKYGKVGIVAAILSFALVALLEARLMALLGVALLPLSLAAGIAIRKRMRLYHSVLITTGAALAGLTGAFGVLWLLTGQAPIDYAVNAFGAYLSRLQEPAVNMLYQMMRVGDLVTGAVTMKALIATPAPQAIATMQSMLEDYLNYTLVGQMANYALIIGLVGYLIPCAVAKRTKLETAPIAPFADWALPRRFWLGFVLSYLVAFIGASNGWASFDIAENTIMAVYSTVFLIQGLSFIDYLLKKRGLHSAVRVVLHVVITLLVGNFLFFVGLFENVSNLRRRFNAEGGTVL